MTQVVVIMSQKMDSNHSPNLTLPFSTPGECVCNDIGEGRARFSYIPPTGEEFENLPVIVSQLNPLVYVHNVTDLLLEGVSFKHASSAGISNLGRNSTALLKSQQTFQQTFQQSFQYYRVSHPTIKNAVC